VGSELRLKTAEPERTRITVRLGLRSPPSGQCFAAQSPDVAEGSAHSGSNIGMVELPPGGSPVVVSPTR